MRAAVAIALQSMSSEGMQFHCRRTYGPNTPSVSPIRILWAQHCRSSDANHDTQAEKPGVLHKQSLPSEIRHDCEYWPLSTFPRDLHSAGPNWRLTVPCLFLPGNSGVNPGRILLLPIVEFWVLKESGTVISVAYALDSKQLTLIAAAPARARCKQHDPKFMHPTADEYLASR